MDWSDVFVGRRNRFYSIGVYESILLMLLVSFVGLGGSSSCSGQLGGSGVCVCA